MCRPKQKPKWHRPSRSVHGAARRRRLRSKLPWRNPRRPSPKSPLRSRQGRYAETSRTAARPRRRGRTGAGRGCACHSARRRSRHCGRRRHRSGSGRGGLRAPWLVAAHLRAVSRVQPLLQGRGAERAASARRSGACRQAGRSYPNCLGTIACATLPEEEIFGERYVGHEAARRGLRGYPPALDSRPAVAQSILRDAETEAMFNDMSAPLDRCGVACRPTMSESGHDQ